MIKKIFLTVIFINFLSTNSYSAGSVPNDGGSSSKS